MRYAKKRDSDVDWQLDDERAQERAVRVRRREGPAAPKMTRKMQKVDARLLAMSRADYQDPVATLKPPKTVIDEEAIPPSKRAVQPPPLPIPFPFPFANSAGSGEMPVVTIASPRVTGSPNGVGPSLGDDSFISVHDSWILPPGGDLSGRVNLRSLLPGMAGVTVEGANPALIRSLVPREPEPFTIVPPQFSLPPRT